MAKIIISRVVKGRLMIPKEIRSDDEYMVLSRIGLSGVKLFEKAAWERFCEQIERSGENDNLTRDLKRLLFRMSVAVEIKRGGIRLGKTFAEYISDGDVRIICEDGVYTIENLICENESESKQAVDDNT